MLKQFFEDIVKSLKLHIFNMERSKRLLLINNYPLGFGTKRIERFKEIFKNVGNLECKVLRFDEPKNLNEFDMYILSGSNKNLSETGTFEKYKNVVKLIQTTEKPILGICFGHQLIGRAFGFNVKRMKNPDSEWGKEIKLKLKPFELWGKEEISVEENHKDEIEYASELEDVFDTLAGTENCKVQIIRHKTKKIFGVQFHPETRTESLIKEDGEELIRNFITMV